MMMIKKTKRLLAFILMCTLLFSFVPSAALAEEGTFGSLDEVYWNMNAGNDSASGAQSSPVKSFARAKELLAYNGTIYLVRCAALTADEVWSLEGYGENAKVVVDPSATTGISFPGYTLEVKNITFCGVDNPTSIQGYLFQQGTTGGTLILGEGAIFRNMTVQAGLVYANGGLTVIDGASITGITLTTTLTSLPYAVIFCGSSAKLEDRVSFKSGYIRDNYYQAMSTTARAFGASAANSAWPIKPTGDISVDSIYMGATSALTVEAGDGYQIDSIKKDDATWTPVDGVYSASSEVAGTILSSLEVTVKQPSASTVFDDENGKTVTASIEDSFSGTDVGNIEVDENGVFTIKSAYNGYVIDTITIDGEPVEDAHGLSEYIIDASEWEAGEYEIAVTFAYTLRYDLGLVEVLNSEGETLLSGSIIREGDELTLRATPPDYYDVTTLTINGTSILAELQQLEYTYTVGGFGEIAVGGAVIGAAAAVRTGVPSETITLDETSLSLTEGESAQLTAVFTPSETANKTVVWTSSDNSVAAVSGGGKVFALGAGTATVTAAPMDGGASPVTCKVVVSAEENQGNIVPISDLDDFMAFAEAVGGGDSFAGKTVLLMADIDLSSVCYPASTYGGTDYVNWTPIGSSADAPFSGVFDGNGYTVSGLYSYCSYTGYGTNHYRALFGYVTDGVIKDLTVEGSVTADTCVAGIAGWASGSCISGCVNTARIYAQYSNASGIAAYSSDGTIIVDCLNNATVTIGRSSSAGGIAAVNSSDSSIINCLNAGALSSQGTTGGIAVSNSGYIDGCVNTGKVSSASGSASGIANNSGIIVNSYNSGAVAASANTSNNAVKAAGIAIGSAGVIENCYNTGKLSATGATGSTGVLLARCFAIGGSVNSAGDEGYGAAIYPTVTNCYYSTSITPTSGAAMETGSATAIENLGSGGETDAELKALLLAALGNTYTGDLATPLNSGYPILTWQAETVGHAVTLTHNAAAEHGLTVTAGGVEVQSGGAFNSGKGGTTLTLTMNKQYTVESVTIGSGVVTEVSSEISGDTGTYTYLISGVSEATSLTVKLKEQDPDAGDPPQINSPVSGSQVWDGVEVDVRWYLKNPDAASYEISTAAELAGVAALVNGIVNDDCEIYTPDGMYTAAEWNSKVHVITDSNDADSRFTRVDGNFVFRIGGSDNGGQGQQQSTDIYHYGIEDFNGKTIILTENIDMGGSYSYGGWSGPNYMPIGGQYLVTPGDAATKLSSSFCGAFDGNGHYIYNIYCSRHATGNYGDGQSVGLIGRLGAHDSDPVTMRPSDTGVYDVGVTGYIHANRSVGGIVGKIGRTDGGATIQGCVNYATVCSTDAKGLGGIVGAGWNGGKVVDCYNMGTIRSTYMNPTAGISGSNEIPLKNCYNVGSISAASSSYAMAIGTNNTGAPYSSAVTNCWYLSGSAPGGGYYSSGTAYNDGAMSAEDMKAEAFASQLGGAYAPDTNNINGGYPILQWQADQISVIRPQVVSVSPNGTGAARNGSIAITFSVRMDTGTAGTVTLNGKTLTQAGAWSQDHTVYTVPYTGLAESTAYTVGIAGFADALGVAMADSTDSQFTTGYRVALAVTPEGAAVTVRDSQNEILPQEPDGTYTLPAGDYSYNVTAEGYVGKDDTFTVSGSGQTITVELEAQTEPTYGVTFTVTPSNATVTVRDSQNEILPQEPDGTYTLPAGDYSYTVTADGYVGKSDTFTVSGSGQTITVELEAFTEPTYGVTFSVTPTNATVTVKSGDTTVVPQADGSYQLPDGDYSYSVTADGYVGKSDTFTVSGSGQTITVELEVFTEPTYGVTFSVTPTNATVTVKSGDTTVVPQADGSYQLPAGDYSYTVTAEGYVGKSDTFTVSGSGQTITAKLEAQTEPTYGVTFSITPTNATVTVKSGSTTVVPQADGSYQLPAGDYSYTVTAEGYVTKTGTFTVSDRAMEVSVELEAVSADRRTVTFTTYPKRSSVVVRDSGGNPVTAEPDGSYLLPDGDYTYEVSMTNYTSQTDSFEVQGGDVALERITLTAAVNLGTFADVDTSLWHKNAVEYSVANNLFVGTSTATWEPDTALTRAMFVTVLGKYSGVSNSDYSTCAFGDVPNGEWYTGYTQWAYETGLVAGTGNGNFSPDDAITRQEMAVIFYKYAKWSDVDTDADAGIFSNFPDSGEADTWAETALIWATDNSIINGYANGNLGPRDTATRAQAAQIFMVIIEDIL